MKTVLLCLLMTACIPDAVPNAVVVTENAGEAYDCYTKSHSLDAGKTERQAAFDKCACEAGHCQ